MNTKFLAGMIFTTSALTAASTLGLSALVKSQVTNASDKEHELAIDGRLLKLEAELRSLKKLDAVERGFPVHKKVDGVSSTAVFPGQTKSVLPEQTANQHDKEFDIEQLKLEVIRRQQPEYRQKLFVERGFTPDEAASITRAESDADLVKIQDQYARLKSQRRESQTPENRHLPSNNILRSKFGDDFYERYLEAKGLPTSVSVSTVIPGSAGQNAGLLPGDQIRGYAGNRVFNMAELSHLTVDGQEGEIVLLDVARNGDLVQLTIPRGPIGVVRRNY